MSKPAVLPGPTADLFCLDFKGPIYEIFATNARPTMRGGNSIELLARTPIYLQTDL